MTSVQEMLEKLRASRARVQEQLAHVAEEQMTLPVPWREQQTSIRFMFYRLIAHEVEHTVHLIKTLNALGIAQGEAELILNDLQASRGKLEGLLVGLSDENMDREPSEGEWSPRKVLEHIISGEEGYTSRIQEALQGARESGKTS